MTDDAPAIDTNSIVNDKWVLLEKVASGGFGCIFKAHAKENERVIVAVKTEKKNEQELFGYRSSNI